MKKQKPDRMIAGLTSLIKKATKEEKRALNDLLRMRYVQILLEDMNPVNFLRKLIRFDK